MLNRDETLKHIRVALKRSRIVTILGPRQCGKTTLAREIVASDSSNYFDLENPESIERLANPKRELERLRGTIVLDEIQRRPDLFPILRVLADRKPLPAKFIILGSASVQLLRQSSESLAGRIERIEMGPFSLQEVGFSKQLRHWLWGGFPRSFLAKSAADSAAWRKNYIQIFLERDLPQWGISIPASSLLRFLKMAAHYHGQIWNGAEPARSLGISESTVRRYLDILSGVFMIRQLQPWFANLGKRQIKSPKIYFYDTGLLHSLMGIHSEKDLFAHPKCGASWEGYVIEEIFRACDFDEAYFWGTHNGAEIDLLLMRRGKMYGVECKYVDAPKVTASMTIALKDLKLERIAVIYPGKQRYEMADRIEAVPLQAIVGGWKSLFK